jgi:hypothetical protein
MQDGGGKRKPPDHGGDQAVDECRRRNRSAILQPTGLANLAAGLIFFALLDFRRLFKALATADFRHQSALFASLREAAKGAIKLFSFANLDKRQALSTSFQAGF